MRLDSGLCKQVDEWSFGLGQIGARRGHLTQWGFGEELICVCGENIDVGHVSFFKTIFNIIKFLVRVQILYCLIKL